MSDTDEVSTIPLVDGASFAVGTPDVYFPNSSIVAVTTVSKGTEAPTDSINSKLFKSIAAIVSSDGIRSDSILAGQSIISVTENAVENIYYDVSEFFYWYFVPDDWAGRNQFMTTQKKLSVPSSLLSVVKESVQEILQDMKDAELIPEGAEGDVESVSRNLARYILNWEGWYYDRKDREEEEDQSLAIYEEIYVDSDYGDLTNLTNQPYEDPLL